MEDSKLTTKRLKKNFFYQISIIRTFIIRHKIPFYASDLHYYITKRQWDSILSKSFSKFSQIEMTSVVGLEKLTDLLAARGPSLGPFNAHIKPVSRHFYRPVYF